MENLDIQKLWRQYSALEEKNQLTPKIIKQMLHQRSANEMKGFLRLEYLNLFFCLLIIGVLLFSIFKYLEFPWILWPSFSGVLVCLVFMVVNFMKIKIITNINYNLDSMLETSAKILKVKQLFIKERLLVFFLMPVLFLSLFPPILLMVRGEYFMENLLGFALRMGIAIVLGTIIAVLVYKYYYFPKLNALKKEFDELAGFEGRD